jgi:hypothetical protein
MTAHFTDFADFRSVPRRWVNGIIAYVVGEGTIHLYLLGDKSVSICLKLDHCLCVHDLLTKTMVINVISSSVAKHGDANIHVRRPHYDPP